MYDVIQGEVIIRSQGRSNFLLVNHSQMHLSSSQSTSSRSLLVCLYTVLSIKNFNILYVFSLSKKMVTYWVHHQLFFGVVRLHSCNKKYGNENTIPSHFAHLHCGNCSIALGVFLVFRSNNCYCEISYRWSLNTKIIVI